MPPKAAAAPARPATPTPPPAPSGPNDANDILVLQDFMDTIDQIPVEMTRVHSDLNELGAVLYSTLCNLERKLHQLIDWVQDPSIGPERRFGLLQEIAEEAARYKLGGDDKIRVAGGACDGIMAHQRHISDLLNSSTLLEAEPPSPYTATLTLPAVPVPTAGRRGGRTTGSPFTGKDGGGSTPKRKKKTKDVGKDDDDVSSVNGKEDKKKAASKRKKPNRAVSPSDSIASGYSKPAEPVARTARQIAAAAAKAKAKAKAADDSDDDTGDERRGTAMAVTASADSLAPSGALGVDLGGSREGSSAAKKQRSRKRGRDDASASDEEDEEPPRKNGKKGGASASAAAAAAAAAAQTYEEAEPEGDGTAGETELDSKVYCTCRQVSYGEMIGCDDDDCEIEWYHVACLNLDKAPEGNWICPQCIERRKRHPKTKKPSKAKRK